MDLLDFTDLWSWSTSAVAPPPVDTTNRSPGDWRAVDPRIRRLILRGILPEEFEDVDMREILELTDDLDNL